MPEAIFVAPLVNGSPDMPPMDLPAGAPGYCIAYLDGNGQRAGGWWCLGEVPEAPTCLVVVKSTEAVLDLMAADAKYLFVEDVPNGAQ